MLNKTEFLCRKGTSKPHRKTPRLVLIAADADSASETWSTGFIMGDGMVLECCTSSLVGMVLELLYAYYAWGLIYPKQYQLLGCIQQFVLKDAENTFHKSTN